jgi:DNA-directed RNA polymerase sigma subunit (sigma70/sigma32)
MRGGVTLDAVADAINTTRERVRQIESRALAKLRAAGLAPELLEDLAEIVECRDVREDAR